MKKARALPAQSKLLREIGDDNIPNYQGKNVVIIGGGNVAMDVTRSAIRFGAKRVTCVYRRRQVDMTAQAEEVEGAIAEGAVLMTMHSPVRINPTKTAMSPPSSLKSN